MSSLVLRHVLRDNGIVMQIQFRDDKVLFFGENVAGSPLCQCFCNADCLSVTFAGFDGDGFCACINGTYTLERRGTPDENGPWVYSYCASTECGDEQACREVTLTASCGGYAVRMVIGDIEVTGTAGSGDCENLTFSSISCPCDTVGTITTAVASCGESEETRCCDAPPCASSLVSWEIVDLTSGITLETGSVDDANDWLWYLPTPWRTRSWSLPKMPQTITIGLFVTALHTAGNGSSYTIKTPLEIWTVTPRKCSGGLWWDEHTWSPTWTNPKCGDTDPLTYTAVGLGSDTFVTQFDGTWDGEWTNTANWSAPPLSVPNYLRALPTSSSSSVTIAGSVLGDSSEDAQCSDLYVSAGATVGIKITAAGSVSIDGAVLGQCECQSFCDPHVRGFIDSASTVTVSATGVIRGKVAGAGVTITDGLNDGGMVAAEGGTVTFDGTAQNRGFVRASSILFYGTSKNLALASRARCEWGDIGAQLSQIGTPTIVSFYGNAENHGDASGALNNFFDYSKNFGIAGSSADFQGNSENHGRVGDNSGFSADAVNYGTVDGGAYFSFGAINAGTVGGGDFSGGSRNNGTVLADAVFSDAAENHGTVRGNATFNGNSSNFGTVLGTITCNTTGTCEP